MTNEQAQRIRDLQESATLMIDNLPQLWCGLFRKCVEEGFTEQQALELVKTFVAGQSRS